MNMRKLSLCLVSLLMLYNCQSVASRLSDLCNKFHADMLLKKKISNEAYKEVSSNRAGYMQAVENEMYSRLAYNCAIRANANRLFRVSDNDIDAVNRALNYGCLNSPDDHALALLGGYVDGANSIFSEKENNDVRNEAKFRAKQLFEILIKEWQEEDQK